jgi:hypothetical protein
MLGGYSVRFSAETFFFIYNLNQQSGFIFYKLMLWLLQCLGGESSSGESPVPHIRSVGQFLLSRLFSSPNSSVLRSGFSWVPSLNICCHIWDLSNSYSAPTNLYADILPWLCHFRFVQYPSEVVSNLSSCFGTPWPESARELYQPSDRRLLVTTFVDRGCHVVGGTDPYGHILGFLDPMCRPVPKLRGLSPRGNYTNRATAVC